MGRRFSLNDLYCLKNAAIAFMQGRFALISLVERSGISASAIRHYIDKNWRFFLGQEEEEYENEPLKQLDANTKNLVVENYNDGFLLEEIAEKYSVKEQKLKEFLTYRFKNCRYKDTPIIRDDEKPLRTKPLPKSEQRLLQKDYDNGMPIEQMCRKYWITEDLLYESVK